MAGTTYSVGLEFTTKTQALNSALASLNGVSSAARQAQDAFTKLSQAHEQARNASERTATALNSTKASIEKVSASLKEQNSANAETAKNLLRVKRAYEELDAAAKASAASGGKGFDEETISRLRGLTTEIERYREQLNAGRQVSAQFGGELERLGVRKERLTKLTQAQSAAQQTWRGQLQQLGSQIQKLRTDLETAGVGISGLTSKLVSFAAQLGLTVGAIALFKSSLDAAFARGTADQRLRNLTDSTAEYEFAVKAAKVAAYDFGLTQTQASSAIGDLYGRLKGVGYGLKEVNQIYVGFNTVAREGGVAAEEAAGAFFQFSQALGKGKLNGDEFVILGERMPQLLDYIATAAGIGRDQLSQFAQEGKLTGDVLYRAMVLAGESATDLKGKLTEQQATMAQVAQRAEEMKVQLGEALAPSFLVVMEGLAGAALFLGKAFERVNDWVKQNREQVEQFVTAGLKFVQITAAVFVLVNAYQALQKAIAIAAAAKAFLVGLTGKGLILVAAAAAAATAAYAAMGAAIDGVGAEIQGLATESAAEMAKLKEEVNSSADGFSKIPSKVEDAKEKAKQLKEEQQKVTLAIQEATKAADAQASVQSAMLTQQQSVLGARLEAESAINQVYLQQAERQLQMATSQEERLIAAQQVYDLTVKQAAIELQQAQAAIVAATKKATLDMQSAQLKEREVASVVALAQAQGTVTAAHYEALAAQQAAVQIAGIQLETTVQMASEQMRAAQAIYEGKVAAAAANLETATMSKNIQEGAAGAAQLAANLGQAASNAASMAASMGSFGGSGTGRLYGMDFGEAGKNAYFESQLTSQINDLRNTYGNRPRQFTSGYYSIMQGAMAQASAYNSRYQSQAYNSAKSSWYKGVRGYATGGYVTGPEMAMIGEGGEAEYVIPASKMSAAMANYGSGKRGGSVLSGGTPQVNLTTGPVTQMDGQRYLTLGDAQKIASDATRQTLSLIRRDPGVRRSLGVNQ